MARTVPADHAQFLATLRERHERQRAEDRPYEAMMYHARDPPDASTLADIVRFTREDRDVRHAPTVPEDPACYDHLSALVRKMRWPDPAPLTAATTALEEWDTLHTSTFLHTMIPDYPVWGPEESHGLERLGIHIPYEDAPARAEEAYGRYILAVKTLREEARFQHVPESHHYLTRIVQSALKELAEAAP